MNCPVDGSELRVSERQGVEVDYCPTCRGVWLDRGELDKILDRSARTPYADEPEVLDDDRPERQGGHGKRRRRSLLEDLLDFG